MAYNGLMSLASRAIKPKARGGWQPDWVHFHRQPANWAETATSGLERATYLTGQPTVFDSAFYVMRVRNVIRSQRKRYFWGYQSGGGIGMFNIGGSSTADAAGKSAVTATGNVYSGAAHNFAAATGYDVQSLGREFIYALSLNGSTGEMHTAIYEYGWQVWTSGYVAGGVEATISPLYPTLNMDLDCDTWNAFGANYGFQGDAAYLWFTASNDTASFVDLTSDTNLRMLQGNPEDWTFSTPLVWFQGEATSWQAGTNRGSGGDFTGDPNVVDA